MSSSIAWSTSHRVPNPGPSVASATPTCDPIDRGSWGLRASRQLDASGRCSQRAGSSFEKGQAAPGMRVIGVYLGKLPCGMGAYAPQPGDRVVAYLARDEPPCQRCCDMCEQQRPPLSAESTPCWAECQRTAHETCRQRRADLEILGNFSVAPVESGRAILARFRQETFSQAVDSLETSFVGGPACEQTLPDHYAWQEDLSARFRQMDAGPGPDYHPAVGVFELPGIDWSLVCGRE